MVKTSSSQSGGQAHGWGASPDPSIRKDWRVSCFQSVESAHCTSAREGLKPDPLLRKQQVSKVRRWRRHPVARVDVGRIRRESYEWTNTNQPPEGAFLSHGCARIRFARRACPG